MFGFKENQYNYSLIILNILLYLELWKKNLDEWLWNETISDGQIVV